MNPETPQLLVVDDDLVACTRLQHYFEARDYTVFTAHNGAEMWRKIAEHPIALVLLDVGLPGKDGLELARELRAHDEYLGIILVTARDDDIDKIVGLESGANDYVTKPYNSRELLARVKITLRETHFRRPREANHRRRFGRWTLDMNHRYVHDDHGARVALSRGEISLLIALARQPGKVKSRQQLMAVISDRPQEVSHRTVDVLIARLRRKLETNPSHPELLVTARGEGYALLGVLD